MLSTYACFMQENVFSTEPSAHRSISPSHLVSQKGSKLTIFNMPSKSAVPKRNKLAIKFASQFINFPQNPRKSSSRLLSPPIEQINSEGKTHVNHPPSPSTETKSPEFPTLRYFIPVFLGSSQIPILVVCAFNFPLYNSAVFLPFSAPRTNLAAKRVYLRTRPRLHCTVISPVPFISVRRNVNSKGD
jgi:hypothetical protein